MTLYAYQLYSSRNFGGLAETLGLVADLGYTGVEGYGELYSNPANIGALRSGLDAAGLEMKSGHFGLDMVEDDPGGVTNIATQVGMTHVFVPHIAADLRPTDPDGWRAFGVRLAEVAKPLVDAGLTFGWHNHDFEFQALPDGTFPIDAIFSGGSDLAFEFDVAWAARAGQDPFHWIEKLGTRVVAAHVKDIAPAGECLDEDGWADVGQGTMDWAGLIAALKDKGCERFVVEHDNPSDDARFAKRSIDFLNEL